MIIVNSKGKQKITDATQDILTTKGDLLTYGTALARLSVGTNNYILTPDSSQSLGIKWNKQGLVFLNSATASASSSINFTDLTGFSGYYVTISHVVTSVDGGQIYMRTSTDNGSNYDSGASDYEWQYIHSSSSTVAGSRSTGSSVYFVLGSIGNAANETGSAQVVIYQPAEADYCPITSDALYANTAGAVETLIMVGRRLAAADVNAIQFIPSTGNIASGVFRIYGVG